VLETWIPLSALLLSALVVASFVAGLVQGTIGFGYAIVSVPILSLLDARLAPVPQLLAMTPLIVGIFWRERTAADWKGAWWTTIGRFPGTWLGVLLLGAASAQTLDLVVGVIVLGAVFALAGGRSIPRNRWTELTAGLLSGLGAVVSSIGGPPIALLYKDDAGPTVRATLSAIFLVGAVVTISGRIVANEISELDLVLSAWAAPPTLLGLWLSRYLTGRVEGAPLRISIMVVSALSALGLIGRALLG